jgi:hypothetical protein
VSDDVAREAATRLKAGYISNRKVTGGKAERAPVHLYYTPSIAQACAMNHFLKGVVEENSVTPHYLLRRMHEVDPDLRYSPLDYKMEAELMSGRQKEAMLQLNCWNGTRLIRPSFSPSFGLMRSAYGW